MQMYIHSQIGQLSATSQSNLEMILKVSQYIYLFPLTNSQSLLSSARMAQLDEKSEKTLQQIASKRVPYVQSQIGLVYCWGKGLDGQLGLGFKNEDKPLPTEVSSLSFSRIRQIGCGQSFTAAIAGILFN
jgi:alpha-tubulin suppressor-like RCC1 family protein